MGDRLTVGVAGLGLIGGSFALDLQAKGHAVLGHDIDPESCSVALERGMAHAASDDAAVLEDAAAVLVAVPVRETGAVLDRIAALEMPNLRAVLDAGSTKEAVIAEAARALGERKGLFVPCHPIAGTEHSGVRAALTGLFSERKVIVCGDGCEPDALSLARTLWEECGASTVAMESGFHDRVFAAVSHLPHLLAFTLVGDLGNRPDKDLLLEHAASGFADFTRIAGSDPDMWRDVCLTNRENVVAEVDAYIEGLQRMRDIVDRGDGPEMRAYFDSARALRDGWLRGGKDGD